MQSAIVKPLQQGAMVNGASSRVPVPRFEGRFLIAFLSTLILYHSVFADVTQRVEILGSNFPCLR